MRIFGKGECGPTRHVWDKDPNEIDVKTHLFTRVDCVRCGKAIDGVAAKLMFAELGRRVPGRVAKS